MARCRRHNPGTQRPMSHPEVIYKICSAGEWAAAREAGRYAGSADDARDGFIHFSTREQLAGTAAKHFRDKRDLLLVTVAASRLGAALRWEPSRGGALFPHLYAPLELTAVSGVRPLPLRDDGVPDIPQDIA